MSVIAVIPARWASRRFPGKLFVDVHGKPLIQRTFESAEECQQLDQLIVATDDQRIFDHFKSLNKNVVMTSSGCSNGTERVAEAVSKLSDVKSEDIIINLQGDEPMMCKTVIAKMVDCLLADTAIAMCTAICPIDPEDLNNPSIVKCVTDEMGRALYFSRAAIPGKKHLGIYGFRKHFLDSYVRLKPTSLQKLEDLEQLKVLEHGFSIQTVEVEDRGIGVDTESDLEKLKEILCRQNTSS